MKAQSPVYAGLPVVSIIGASSVPPESLDGPSVCWRAPVTGSTDITQGASRQGGPKTQLHPESEVGDPRTCVPVTHHCDLQTATG